MNLQRIRFQFGNLLDHWIIKAHAFLVLLFVTKVYELAC